MTLHCRLTALVLAAALCAGCTSLSLEQRTLTQLRTTVDYRYEAALKCLAAVANDPSHLPSFAILSDGTTRVQDTGQLSNATLWLRSLSGFASDTMGVTAARTPQEQWTIAPVADSTQLEAMRAACQWALYGPERALRDHPGLLDSAVDDPTPGPHFGVAKRLAQLPPGWLHLGRRCDVPGCASYRAHVGSCWVWVTPDGMEGLSEFLLVLHDISTIDINSGGTSSPPLLVTLEMHEIVRTPRPVSSPTAALLALGAAGLDPLAVLMTVGPLGSVTPPRVNWAPIDSKELVFPVTRVIRPECKQWIQDRLREGISGQAPVHITWEEWMACTRPYYGPRITNTGVSPGPAEANAVISAQIQAAGSGKTPFQIPGGIEAPIPSTAIPFPIQAGAPAPIPTPSQPSPAPKPKPPGS